MGQSTRTNRHDFGEVRPKRGAAGLTLIELGFVIVVLAVIVAVALGFYNTLSENKKISDTTTDVASIRLAMSQYAGGLPLVGLIGRRATDDGSLGTEVPRTEADLTWRVLAPYLPGRLRSLAAADEDKTLETANAWQSTYEIVVVGASDPWFWDLVITGIPPDVIDRVRDKLASGARGVPVVDGNKLTIQFEVGA